MPLGKGCRVSYDQLVVGVGFPSRFEWFAGACRARTRDVKKDAGFRSYISGFRLTTVVSARRILAATALNLRPPRVESICTNTQILTIVEARKLEHGFRRISARIPYTLP